MLSISTFYVIRVWNYAWRLAIASLPVLCLAISLMAPQTAALAMTWPELQQELARQTEIPREQLHISKDHQFLAKEIASSQKLDLMYYNFSYKKNQLIVKVNDANKRKLYLTFDIIAKNTGCAEENDNKGLIRQQAQSLMVKKGQKINIVYQKGNLTIETEGIVLESAQEPGQSIKVKLRRSNQVVVATVLDAETARVVQ